MPPRNRTRARPPHVTDEAVSNDEAVRDEVRRTMSVVGIGSRYHDARFADFPGGEDLKTMLLSMWTTENIRLGYGITIAGVSSEAGHLHMMLARSLHLSGVGVRVVGLQGLVNQLQDREGDTVADTIGALFIRKFMDKKKCPLRPYEVELVEELVDRRVSNNLAVFPWFAGVPAEEWWSDHILEQLKKPRNVRFKVGA